MPTVVDAERQPEIDFLLRVLGVVFVPRSLIGLASLGLTTVAGFIKRHRSSDVPCHLTPNVTPIVRLAQARGLRRWRSNKNVAAAEVRARADVAITMTSAVLLEAGRCLDEAGNIQNRETISVMLDDLDADSRQRSEQGPCVLVHGRRFESCRLFLSQRPRPLILVVSPNDKKAAAIGAKRRDVLYELRG
jgi:hypothetical protein